MEEQNQASAGNVKKPFNKLVLAYLLVAVVIVVAGYFFLQSKPNAQNQPQANNNQNTNNSTTMETTNTQGLKIETLKQGTGEAAKAGDLVTVNYTGTLENGKMFDSSLNPGRTPFQFTLGLNSVIKGWELGVLGMKVGEKRKLTIAPELGYGASGAGGVIPPNATLIFDVELLKIN